MRTTNWFVAITAPVLLSLTACAMESASTGDLASLGPIPGASATPLPAARVNPDAPSPAGNSPWTPDAGTPTSSPGSNGGGPPTPAPPGVGAPPPQPGYPTPSYPPQSQPQPSAANPALEQVRNLCVQRINDYRASVGRAPLNRVAAAEPCLDAQAHNDGTTGAAHGAFGSCNELAQNECPGWGGDLGSALPGCLQQMWNEGPGGGHYDNMSNPNYTSVACGVYQTPNGDFWIVQDFR